MMMTRSGGSEIKTRSVLWIVALGFFSFFLGVLFYDSDGDEPSRQEENI